MDKNQGVISIERAYPDGQRAYHLHLVKEELKTYATTRMRCKDIKHNTL